VAGFAFCNCNRKAGDVSAAGFPFLVTAHRFTDQITMVAVAVAVTIVTFTSEVVIDALTR